MKAAFAVLSSALLANACAAAPGQWARDLASELRCDMTINEVESKAQKPVKDLKRAWGTHFVEHDGTDFWMSFENGRLKSYQIAWVRSLEIVEKEPPVLLCGASK